jgi:molybdopterin molybdotransferase
MATPVLRPPLKPLDTALAELLVFARVLQDVERISTFDADTRVLAHDVVSPLQVPPQDNSAMDGYALRYADIPHAGVVLPVSQRIPAGSAGTPLQPGTAARIFTGAPIPAGADAVVMQEDCEALAEAVASVDNPSQRPAVRFNSVPKPGQNIRRAGEDVTLDSVVLQLGTRLTPAALGLAASVGQAQLDVARRPRVALFSTGDELVMPGDVAPQDMKPGAIFNSNRFFQRALLARLGCTVTDMGIVPDRLDATIATLRKASLAHDLVLTCGGVSVGEEDHVRPAVLALGELDMWQLSIKPGKPFAYGRVGAAHFIGLPGNPVSSLVTFMLLVRPFLLRLQGVRDVAPRAVMLRADFAWPRPDRRREFLRARHNGAGGLDLFANQSSGVLTAAGWGDGLVDAVPGVVIAPGDTVRFLPFAELLA